MQLPRRSSLVVLVYALAALIAFVLPAPAQAACALREAYDKSRADWEAAHQAFRDVKLDPGIDAKLSVVAGLVDITLAGGGEDFDQIILADKTLTQPEKDAYTKWLRQKKEAYAQVIATREAMQDAGKAWREAMAKKDEALTKADTLVRQEQAWLTTEKAALSKLEVNSPEYLDRASKILERLKKSYADVQKELGPHRDCFEDAQAFLSDLDKRAARIAEVEAEIAKRRGGGASVVSPDPADPAMALVQPGAAVWVCAGPEVKVIRDTKGILTSEGPTGASWRVTADDGSVGDATVTITKGPKLRLVFGETPLLIMKATAQPPAWAHAGWTPGDFGGGIVFQGQQNDSAIDTGRNEMVATWHRQFIGHDPKGAPCFMRTTIGRNVGNAVFDPQVDIIWTYTLEGAAGN